MERGEKNTTQHITGAPPPPPCRRTIVRAMKEKTAIPVNRMVGISITTADHTLVPKKEIAAIQPLQGDGSRHAQYPQGEKLPGMLRPQEAASPFFLHPTTHKHLP